MFKDIIMTYLKDQAIDQISKKIWIDPSLLKWQWSQDAIGSLVTGLFRNTQKEEWLDELNRAIQKDHDGSLFDDITSLVTKGDEGNKIVWHILWSKQNVIAELIAKKLNISAEQANSLLSFVAPMVMWYLWKATNATGGDATALKKIIQDEEQELTKESNTPSIVLNLLDKDGDGDVDIHDFIQ